MYLPKSEYYHWYLGSRLISETKKVIKFQWHLLVKLPLSYLVNLSGIYLPRYQIADFVIEDRYYW